MKPRIRIKKEMTYEELKQRYVKVEKRYNLIKEEMIANGEPVISEINKQKPFIYTKKQMEKLAKFGMITCANCQNPVAEEANHCPKCSTIFRVNLQSNFE
jgi:hypothetical protein